MRWFFFAPGRESLKVCKHFTARQQDEPELVYFYNRRLINTRIRL
jgi:hypothetical protein